MRQLLSDIALIPDKHRRGKAFERAVMSYSDGLSD
ncbi:uncharacterized protein METZ01_LOCUS230866 [marine metagenome]|uniref:Uncharacterized protein n=1 Tax=marine metagenome TaxID=408172 RepID=A0A382GT03_9ZZZZ